MTDFTETFTSEIYDLDLKQAYLNIEMALQGRETVNGRLPAPQYLQHIMETIENYCKDKNEYYPFYFTQHVPLIIRDFPTNFPQILGLALMTYDINKIPSFLDHQSSRYKGEDKFYKIVDAATYRYIVQNTPIPNDERLACIARWANHQRNIDKVNTTESPTRSSVKKGFDEQASHDNNLKRMTFENYFNDEDQIARKLIVEKFKHVKPKEFAALLEALIQLGYLKRDTISANYTQFHACAKVEFPKIGSRQAVKSHLNHPHRKDTTLVNRMVGDIRAMK